MKKTTIIGLMATMLLLAGCSKYTDTRSDNTNESAKEVVTIGVTQIAEHPSLDQAREGFIKALEDKGYGADKVKINYKNSQGDVATAQTIAQGFVTDKVDLILAISTPSAQTAYNATKDIPILITAVTDPVSAGVANSLENSGTNVTGTSDASPLDAQLDLMVKLVGDVKKLGVIYNTGEVNSQVQVDQLQEACDKREIELVVKGITNINEAMQAMESLGDVEALYMPSDNVLTSSMPAISSKALELKVPIIGSVESHVTEGGLATVGINYYELGYQTGLQAAQVLQGSQPTDIPIETLNKVDYIYNEETAKALGIKLPE